MKTYKIVFEYSNREDRNRWCEYYFGKISEDGGQVVSERDEGVCSLNFVGSPVSEYKIWFKSDIVPNWLLVTPNDV